MVGGEIMAMSYDKETLPAVECEIVVQEVEGVRGRRP
jgi:hypothetical protein